MRRPILWPLARRLRAAGFSPRLFPYATLWRSAEQAVPRLQAELRALGPGPVHIVGHSLGGVAALAALHDGNNLPPGRVVCLGSPINGSAAARGMREHHLRLLVGRSGPFLERGVQLPPDREVGMIAGTLALGGGHWVADLGDQHDGTVGVAETWQPGLTEHLKMRVSHSGLIFSGAVAEATIRFLRTACFGTALSQG
ncbi:alpha/beta fold hydrolase [Pseudoxanthomonas sp. CAU 1598]|uniref:Alpha/beta fold hydrolase n=2 Tax=Pseudomarimonas arenosa TaxID=2774145 RepID=A0AAW3ZIL9_9GAMM|nr:alpha/beta fold hydrolase [Pseudomarimonas arenosa]